MSGRASPPLVPFSLRLRTAPPVSVRIGADRPSIATVSVLAALTGSGLALWLGQWVSQFDDRALPPSVIPWLAAACGALSAALAALLAMHRAACGKLAWDGRQWAFEPAPDVNVVGELQVAIDFDGWMLLRWRPVDAAGRRTGSARWLAVSRAACRADWHAWRCAVYCPRPRSALPADEAHASR